MPSPPQTPSLPEPFVLEEKPAIRKGQNGRTRSRPKSGMEGLLTFIDPLPPPMRFPDDLPALYAWMLEKDPVIPNNTVRLEEIHAEVFRDKPAARLGSEQHILFQVADDLFLHATEEALVFHLAQLASAYRRAADTYHTPESNGPTVVNQALWEMASLASRMRMEAWVYHTRYGETPRLPSTRQRELPLRFPGN